MCGICGVVSVGNNIPLQKPQLFAMRDSLLHRGPDDAGHHFAPGVALGSRRLSVLDLSEKGHMPMSAESGRYWIIYNGEIYNFQNLRNDLEGKGVRFQSHTDTEVILNLYATEGPNMLDRLNGMFSIAIWDNKKRCLFLARDRLGIKPLFYAWKGGKLYFASEIKALFAAGLEAQFDASRLEELVYFHHVAGESTPYLDIKRLLPGYYLTWQNGNIRKTRWWHLAERSQHVRPEIVRDPEQWFQTTFDDAVKLRRISDVPVGVFLSGGLDSSSVVASMARQSEEQILAFTIRFEESEYDEGPLAQAVAAKYHLAQHELKASSAQVVNQLIDTVSLLDEPMVHASDIHLRMIAAYAKKIATVLLSGEGSDETLAGYGWYQSFRILPVLERLRFLTQFGLVQKMHPRLKKLSQFLSLDPRLRMMLRNLSSTMPGDLVQFGLSSIKGTFEYREDSLQEAVRRYPDEPVRQAMYYDLHTYLCSILDRNDRMTMAASVECRTPFLDYRLVEGLFSLPSKHLLAWRKNKSLLRKAVGQRLPQKLLQVRKKGFDVPWPAYMRQNDFLKEQIFQLPCHPVWEAMTINRGQMQKSITDFFRGTNTHALLIWHLLMIAIWHDVCIKGRQKPSRV